MPPSPQAAKRKKGYEKTYLIISLCSLSFFFCLLFETKFVFFFVKKNGRKKGCCGAPKGKDVEFEEGKSLLSRVVC